MLHAWPFELHLPAFGQSPFLKQLAVIPSLQRPPPQLATVVQAAPGVDPPTHEPFFVHWAFVWHAAPGVGPPLHVPLTDGHWPVSVHERFLHSWSPMFLHWLLLLHTAPFWHVLIEQVPPVSGQSAALAQAVVPSLHRPFVSWQVAAA